MKIKFSSDEMWNLSQPLMGSSCLRKGFYVYSISVFQALCALILGKPATSPSRLQRRRALLVLFATLGGPQYRGKRTNDTVIERLKISYYDLASNLKEAGKRWITFPIDQILVIVEIIDLNRDLAISWEDFYNFSCLVFEHAYRDKGEHMKEHLTKLYKELTITAFNATPSDKTYKKLVRLAQHARKSDFDPSPLLALVQAEGPFGRDFNQYNVEEMITALGASICDDDSDEDIEFIPESNPASATDGIDVGNKLTNVGPGETLDERFQNAENEGRQSTGSIAGNVTRSNFGPDSIQTIGSGKRLSRHLQASLSETVQQTSKQLSGTGSEQSTAIEDAQTLWRALRALETRLHGVDGQVGSDAGSDVIIEALQSARERELQGYGAALGRISAELSPVSRLEDTLNSRAGQQSSGSSALPWTPSDASRRIIGEYLTSPLPDCKYPRKGSWTESRVTFAKDVNVRDYENTGVDDCEERKPDDLLPMELFRKSSQSSSVATESDPNIFRSPHRRQAKQAKNVFDPRTFRWKTPTKNGITADRFDYSNVGDLAKINTLMFGT